MKHRKEAGVEKEREEAFTRCSITRKEVVAWFLKKMTKNPRTRKRRVSDQGENEKKLDPHPFFNIYKFSMWVHKFFRNSHMRPLIDLFATRCSLSFLKLQKGGKNSKITT